MDSPEKTRDLARYVGAAAGAGWWCLLICWLFIALQGVLYMIFTGNESLIEWVGSMWRVPTEQVREIWFWFISAMKFFLFLGFAGCIFLSLWAKRLRRVQGV